MINQAKPRLTLVDRTDPKYAPANARFMLDDLAPGSILRRLPMGQPPELWRVAGFSDRPFLRKGRYRHRPKSWQDNVKLVRLKDGLRVVHGVVYIAYSAMWQLVGVPPMAGQGGDYGAE